MSSTRRRVFVRLQRKLGTSEMSKKVTKNSPKVPGKKAWKSPVIETFAVAEITENVSGVNADTNVATAS